MEICFTIRLVISKGFIHMISWHFHRKTIILIQIGSRCPKCRNRREGTGTQSAVRARGVQDMGGRISWRWQSSASPGGHEGISQKVAGQARWPVLIPAMVLGSASGRKERHQRNVTEQRYWQEGAIPKECLERNRLLPRAQWQVRITPADQEPPAYGAAAGCPDASRSTAAGQKNPMINHPRLTTCGSVNKTDVNHRS